MEEELGEFVGQAKEMNSRREFDACEEIQHLPLPQASSLPSAFILQRYTKK